ncbi:hypothetical protein [Sphingomonas gilva]|uniref:hypothetical protein n=1 Tax=Sphingomonas gilva TaxID=2305907 RepID=UPI000E56CC67|nr:hypothetical protein [Sphingomonas gilva]
MRKVRTHPDQIAFAFEAPQPARGDAQLAGLDRAVAGIVGTALKDDVRSRDEIAGAMTALLSEPVSRLMLDAYASPAREGHNISFGRALALIAVTERFDLLDQLLRRIGAAVLVGEEINAALLGHLQARKRQIDAEIRAVQQRTTPIFRGNDA